VHRRSRTASGREIWIGDRMSVGEHVPQVLELSGEPTIWRATDLGPRRIDLPYLSRTPRWRIVVLLGGAPLTLWAWIWWPFGLIEAISPASDSPGSVIYFLFGLAFMMPLLVIVSEATLLAVHAAFHRSYHFGFDREKVWHFQLSEPIAFQHIKRVEVIFAKADPLLVRITADPPFRLRFRSLLNRQRAPTRFSFAIGIAFDDKILLTDAICHLVEANGGVVQRTDFLSLWFWR
jgi:hypothetical protein